MQRILAQHLFESAEVLSLKWVHYHGLPALEI